MFGVIQKKIFGGTVGGKSNYLKKNLLLFFISTVATKVITFVMLPLYTSCISTSDFGIISYITTLSDLIYPITTLCIQNGLLRFVFDSNYTQEDVFTSSCYILFRGSVIYGIGTVIGGLFVPWEYAVFFFFYGLVNGYDVLLSYFYRGIGKARIMMETSIIRAFMNCLSCIILIAFLHFELRGYFLGIFIGCMSSILYGTIKCRLWKKLTFRKNITTVKALQTYSAPLIATSVGWWISSFIDRFVVIHYVGNSENGIYAVAYRIPTIVSVMSQIMARAWTLSAIKDFDSQDTDGFINKTYRSYNFVLVAVSSLLIFLNIPIAKILYAKDFFAAWKYTGALVISAMFVSLSNFYDGIFSHVKDTKSTACAGAIAAIINTCLSIILTPFMGAMGAAVGTAVSHMAVWVSKLFFCRKYIRIRNNYVKDIFVYMVLCVQGAAGLFGFSVSFIFFSFLVVVGIFILYADECLLLQKSAVNMVRDVSILHKGEEM